MEKIYSFSRKKLNGRQNGTRWHYATLRGSMASINRPIHSKITLTYSLHRQIAVHPGEWLPRQYLTSRWPFPRVCSSFLVWEWSPNTAICAVNCTTKCIGTSTIRQRTNKYFLSILYVTHMINYFRPFPAILQATESWVGTRNKATFIPKTVISWLQSLRMII